MESRRATLHKPFTDREWQIVQMIGRLQLTNFAIARLLGVQERTVHEMVQRAARKIPGDLEPRPRIIAWWRGASVRVLGPVVTVPTVPRE